MKKIALEEHFVTDDFLVISQKEDFAVMNPHKVEAFQKGLLDMSRLRIDAMDKAGIEISILSLTAPGVQGIRDVGKATLMARQANEFLAEKIALNPNRFRGFAALSLSDTASAISELERCVKEHRFVGGLINGRSGGLFLDEEQFLPFWKKVEELDVPIYLHPGSQRDIPHSFRDHEELAGSLWGWTVGVGTHALRLVFSGLFDRFPRLKVILGHMGETLPYLLWRLDSRWEILKHPRELKKPPSQYFRDNFYVTTSGVCANGPLMCAIHELGEDRVMFSVDYPYESSEVAGQFVENAPLSSAIREKVCYKNAERLLKL
ncbi:MAG: amidohydrolase family protein [Chlamydiota bacterium]